MHTSIRAALAAVIAVALVAAVFLGVQRVQLEQDFRNVEMAVLYDEVAYLARVEGKQTVETLHELRGFGVTSVFFKEPTLGDLVAAGRLTLVSGTQLELLFPQLVGRLGAMDPALTYIVCDEGTFLDVGPYLEARINARTAIGTPGEGPYVLVTELPFSLLKDLGAGFSRREIDEVNTAGLNVVLQVRTWNGVTGDGIRALAAVLEDVPGLSILIFNDPAVPGYPGITWLLAQELNRVGVPVAEIEFFPQAGLKQVGTQTAGGLIMMHTIPTEEMPKYTIRRAIDRYVLAATERNARLLLIRLFLQPEQTDLWQQNTGLLQKTAQRLENNGLQLATASSLPPYQPAKSLIFLVGLGVIAGGMLLWERFVAGRSALFLGLAAALLWAFLALVGGDSNATLKLMALAAVIIFPTLAVVTQASPRKLGIGLATVMLLKVSAISLIGAALMVGLLSDARFLMKLDQFSGVKLAHLVPLALVALAFAFKPGGPAGAWLHQVRNLLDKPILIKYAVAAAVIGVVGLIYLLRTGNEATMLIAPLELKIRAFLDQVLAVRPRTKEFLLGHPFMLLLLYLGYRDVRYVPLLLLGTVGQISLVNTFAHLHTPLLISLARAGHGLWLGVLIGLALVAVWWLGVRIYKATVTPDIPVARWK